MKLFSRNNKYYITHAVLQQLIKGKVRLAEETDDDPYRPAYLVYTAHHLTTLLPYNLKQIVYALEMLDRNGHAYLDTSRSGYDWKRYSVSCSPAGEQAYDEKFYLEKKLEHQSTYNKAIQEKYWWLWPILAAIAGYIAGWLLPPKPQGPSQEYKRSSQVIEHKISDT